MNTTDGNVTFDLYFNQKKIESINKTRYTICEEELIRRREVYIWVEAHVRNSSCSSPKRSVVLENIVKYDAPQNISMSWSKNNLSLMWKAADNHPAAAEVWFRRNGQTEESWEKIFINSTRITAPNFGKLPTSHCPTVKKEGTPEYQVTVVNLSHHSAHKIQIRQRSTQVKDPLWSDWSPEVIVPAELAHEPEVTMTTKRLNGTREVTLNWKLMSHAAGVIYRQSSHGCPCMRTEKRRQDIKTNNFTIYVSYSPVNISVIAINAAGCSPTATVLVPAESTVDLKICDKTVDNKTSKKNCKQWYKLQDGDLKPEHVITLASKRKQAREQERKSIALLQDYVGYLYFEHMCDGGKPRTVKMCLYYQKEGAPRSKPQDITVLGQTHNSSILSWKAIASEDQRGFLTHYSLCSVKMGSQDELRECHNISVSLRKYRLENLTPGAKYNISLAGVTRAGTGPTATVTIYTLQEKHVNVWLSFGLLFGFFLTSTMCTVILKRIQNKIFPPVPAPVIPEFLPNQLKSQEMLERKEEVHKLILLQLHPEGKTVPQEAEETAALRGKWGSGSDEDEDVDEGDSRMSEGSGDEIPGSTDQKQNSSRVKELTDLEQVDSEIAMLIYRNGLVFDVKTDSP
ncbi:interleukin-12 receptor subunit beta-1 isoform X2 [Paralichthys olivaceus]